MILKIFLIAIIIWIIYSPLTAIYFKFIKKQNYTKNFITWTFDDGPNINYTPKFLDLLNSHNVKAIFFVLGEKVLKYPELSKNIQALGHEIGIHSYNHSHPIFWTPKKTKSEIIKTLNILNNIGIYPRYYRPPHGWVNLYMVYLTRKLDLKILLWNKIPGDWKEDMSVKDLQNSFIMLEKTGGVICLHDSNHNIESKSTAPENTLHAMREYLG